jgi:hypothetical protein
MALELTQPLTDWSIPGIFVGVKGWPARKAVTLTSICMPIYRKCMNLGVTLLYESPRPVTGTALPVPIRICGGIPSFVAEIFYNYIFPSFRRFKIIYTAYCNGLLPRKPDFQTIINERICYRDKYFHGPTGCALHHSYRL